ncbi:MAG: hypothetical protein BWY77_00475 [bacterium ADurb.Bin431]|nr:MAG: hypothetical protein BWY77_00475 [bacterium ADurb.Bin431]
MGEGQGEGLSLLRGQGGLEFRIGDQPRKDRGDHNIKNGADEQRGDDADGQVAAGIARLLCRGRDRIKADIGKEDDRRPGAYPRPAVGGKGGPVFRLDPAAADDNKKGQHDNLDADHDSVEAGALADAPDEHQADEGDDGDSEEIEDDRQSEEVGGVAKDSLHPGRVYNPRRSAVIHRDPVGYDDVESAQKGLEIIRPGDGHGDVADGVLDDQVPTDHPGDELAQGGVGVGVGRTGDGDEGGEFGVAEGGEAADHGGDDKGEHQGRAGARAEGVAGGGGADGGENTRADDRSDAEKGELHRAEHPVQAEFAALRFGDDVIERFDPEKCGPAPAVRWCSLFHALRSCGWVSAVLPVSGLHEYTSN